MLRPGPVLRIQAVRGLGLCRFSDSGGAILQRHRESRASALGSQNVKKLHSTRTETGL